MLFLAPGAPGPSNLQYAISALTPRCACSSNPQVGQHATDSGGDSLIARLDRVRQVSHAFGHGVGDDMDYLLAKYVKHPSEDP
jgi:hypothetical protein